MATAEELRNQGNTAFSAKNFEIAKEKYTAALELLAKEQPAAQLKELNLVEALQKALEATEVEQPSLTAILLANRAQCFLSQAQPDYDSALRDSSAAIALCPTHVKAHYRRAAALFSAQLNPDDTMQALYECEIGLRLDPENSGLNALFKTIKDTPGVCETGMWRHHLSIPHPLVCHVCRTKCNPETKPTSFLCQCGAKAFCCNTHYEASKEEHDRLCQYLYQLKKQKSFTDPPVPDLSSEKSKVAFVNVLCSRFQAAVEGKGTPSEMDQLRQLPRCIGCAEYPIVMTCPKCSLVGWCEKCAEDKTKKEGSHSETLCAEYAVTQRAMQISWREREECFAFNSSDVEIAETRPPPEDFFPALQELMAKDQSPKTIICEETLTETDQWRAYRHMYRLGLPDEWLQHMGDVDPVEGMDKMDRAMRSLIEESLSWPLTVHIGLAAAPKEAIVALKKRLIDEKNSPFIVHVVGAERESFIIPVWEELMHRLMPWQGTETMCVVFVGPTNYVGDTAVEHTMFFEQQAEDALCNGCRQRKKRLFFGFRSTTYEEFLKDPSTNAEDAKQYPAANKILAMDPHVCVAFHAGIGLGSDALTQQWRPALEKIQQRKGKTLNIFTAYNYQEAVADIEILRGKGQDAPLLGSLTLSEPIGNPLRSPILLPDPATWRAYPFGMNQCLYTAW